jgi:hypothetical protein
MPQPILRPQRWAVYTPDQRRIDREPAYVVAVSELLTTPWIGLGRPFASALRHERGSGSPGLQQPKGNETTSKQPRPMASTVVSSASAMGGPSQLD